MFVENGSISVGRIFGVRIFIHWLFFITAIYRVQGLEKAGWGFGFGIAVVAGIFLIILMHEFGHIMACRLVGGFADRVVLWPLGGLAFCHPPQRPWPELTTTIGGPMVNVILIPGFWAYNNILLPKIITENWSMQAAGYGAYLAYVNWFLLIFNLLPVYPMDGGRILQEVLWLFIGYPRSLMIAGMIGTVGGACFIVLGLGVHSIHVPVANITLGSGIDPFLIMIGVMGLMNSWGVYQQSMQIQGWKKV